MRWSGYGWGYHDKLRSIWCGYLYPSRMVSWNRWNGCCRATVTVMRGQPLKRSGSDVEGEALRKCEEARKGNKVRGLSIREALAMQTFYRKSLTAEDDKLVDAVASSRGQWTANARPT